MITHVSIEKMPERTPHKPCFTVLLSLFIRHNERGIFDKYCIAFLIPEFYGHPCDFHCSTACNNNHRSSSDLLYGRHSLDWSECIYLCLEGLSATQNAPGRESSTATSWVSARRTYAFIFADRRASQWDRSFFPKASGAPLKVLHYSVRLAQRFLSLETRHRLTVWVFALTTARSSDCWPDTPLGSTLLIFLASGGPLDVGTNVSFIGSVLRCLRSPYSFTAS